LTTQGGLDVDFLQSHLRQIVRGYHDADIRVSLFVNIDAEQVKVAAKLEADAVEFNTGEYADLPQGAAPMQLLASLRESCRLANRLELGVLAGHGLNTRNVGHIVAIPEISELNIGHSIISRSIFVGIEQAVKEMLKAIKEP
jgi:pyridoxine 5-phosphate synthase